MSWIQRIQPTALAAKKEKELLEMDAMTYTSSDLSGLKVAHEMEDFQEGQETVLILKDSRIADNHGILLSVFNFTYKKRMKRISSCLLI